MEIIERLYSLGKISDLMLLKSSQTQWCRDPSSLPRFCQRGHQPLPSGFLVPEDPTVLLTIGG